MTFNEGARLAVYRLGDWGAEEITPQSLERTALHELLHILLHGFDGAGSGFVNEAQDVEQHGETPEDGGTRCARCRHDRQALSSLP